MKANHRLRPASALAIAMILSLLGSCAERPVQPAPAPPPRPAPTAAPLPTPSPTPTPSWRDVPITPGDWHWDMEGGQSVARFANGMLVLRCERASGTITLERAGTGAGQVPMSIVTSSMSRELAGEAQPGPPPMIAVTFPAHDKLLDAMAFSDGRFVVEAEGLPTLYVPSWPEVSRVIEDCR